jgi:hypothetical protein
MPSLLGFLAGERVIYEQETNQISVIGIMHEVCIPRIKSIPIPPSTSLPLHWTALTIWSRQPGDLGKKYEQMVTLTGDSEEPLMQSHVIAFEMDKPVIRAVSRFPTFPMYREAVCKLVLCLREVPLTRTNQTHGWQPLAAYPLRIHHQILG